MPYQNHHHSVHSLRNTHQLEKLQQDDNLLTRVVLSKELNRKMQKFGESSFRVLYYGDHSSGSVPFMWESQPGTPKHALSETRLPPLTPPPYFSYDLIEKPTKYYSSSSKPSFLQTIFASSRRRSTQPGISLSFPSVNSSMSSSTSYLCSCYSLPSTPMNIYHLRHSGGKNTAMAYGLPRERSDVQGEAGFGSGSLPRSTLCFSGEDHWVSGMDDQRRGRRRMKKMKSAILSIFVPGKKLQG